MKASTILPLVIGAVGIAALNNASTANGCNDGFYPSTETVIYTVPYTYTQTGSPAGSATLHGTDNTVGSTRTYDIAGAHIVEIITVCSKPPNGPYEEIHTLEILTVPMASVNFYGDYDGTTVTPICNGPASPLNFTNTFCASNAPVAAGVLHILHLTDAQTVGIFLGCQNSSSCAALSNPTATSTSTPAMVTTNSATIYMVSMSILILVAGSLLAWVGF